MAVKWPAWYWEWLKKPPLLINILAWLFMANFLIGVPLLWTLPNWAAKAADETHTYALVQLDKVYFVRPLVGWYLDYWMWIAFGLLSLGIALTLTVYKDHVRRVR